MKKNRRDTIQSLHQELRQNEGLAPRARNAPWMGTSADRAKASARQCVVVFSIAAVLAMFFLQGCGVKNPKNQFTTDTTPKNSALRADMTIPGRFVANPSAKPEDVSADDLYSTGCAIEGAFTPVSQLDSRLVRGDMFTEKFRDSVIGGASREFTLDERVESVDDTQKTLKTVGRLTNSGGTTEFTRQCITQAATSISAQTVSCSASPTIDTDENEPCIFANGSTASNSTTIPGTYEIGDSTKATNASRTTAAIKVAVYFISRIESGTLLCPSSGQTYVNVTRKSVSIVSNSVPTLQTLSCGGAVLFKAVSYRDSKKHLLYNSRRELTIQPRF